MFCGFVLVIVGLAAEVVLWTFTPVPSPYALPADHPDTRGWNRYLASETPRNRQYHGLANGANTPGIDGPVSIAYNAFGFRSPRLTSIEKPPGVIRIFCVGGSTTACVSLDDRHTWTEQLQGLLEARRPHAKFDVVNCGVNGQSSRGDLNLIAQRVLTFQPDLIIMMNGLNDWAVAKANDYSPTRTETHCYRYAREKPKWMWAKEVLSESQIFRRIVYAKRQFSDTAAQPDEWDIAGKAIVRLRQRHAQRRRGPLPSELFEPRPEFIDNMRSILGMCRAHGVKTVLVTQPVLWQAEMPEHLRALCWMGYRGDIAFEIADLAQMMNRYNHALSIFAAEQHVLVVDAAARLPKDATVFFDDCHFNVSGARQLAVLIANTLIESGALP